MKSFYLRSATLIICLWSCVTLVSCSGASLGGSGGATPANVDVTSLLENFADETVIPGYEDLVLKTQGLADAADDFRTTPDDGNFQLLKLGWLNARQPWERGEPFAFGPVGFEGFDANMDSWPIDIDGVEAILASADPIDLVYVRNLSPLEKGYHVIEYLIFGIDGTKSAADFTPRELDYIVAATLHLNELAQGLLDSWVIGSGGIPPYRETFVSAGTGNSTFPTQGAAVREMFGALTGCLEEVAEEKILGALEHQDPAFIESQFSQASLNDFFSNVEGAQSAYENSFKDLILTVNPGVAPSIDAQFDEALAQLGFITPPFEISVFDPSEAPQIRDASEAIAQVPTVLNQLVYPFLPF